MKVLWTNKALQQYHFWQKTNFKIEQKIINLIASIKQTPFQGIGKPEPLRENLAGHWSRRITRKDRLVYRVEARTIIIVACRYHYG